MTLTRRQSYDDVATLREAMDNLFDEAFTIPTMRRGTTDNNGAGTTYRLPVDVYETADEFFVEAVVPGVAEDDIILEFEDGTLVVSGRVPPKVKESATYHLREQWRGHFERTLTFPTEIDADEIEATLDNGVITIRLPKTAAVKPRQIPVTVKS